MRTTPMLFVSAFVALVAGGAVAHLSIASDTVAAASTNNVAVRPVLVELFTSEGCSSCPPADALLRQLDGTTTNGRRIIGLSEHVTYWNGLGWADPFSTNALTERQSAYGERFRLDSVYTPQAVVNGSQQLVGNDRGGLLAAIGAQSAMETGMLRILSVQREGTNKLQVTYALKGTLPANGIDLVAVVADDLDQTHVLRGENAGETLRHVSVARTMVPLGNMRVTTEAKAVEIPTMQTGSGRQHVVLFAQTPGLGPVLSVDAQPLK